MRDANTATEVVSDKLRVEPQDDKHCGRRALSLPPQVEVKRERPLCDF